jgi:hypothetical protein
MNRLRTAAVLAAAVMTAGSAFSASPAAAADQAPPCDPAQEAGLTWSAPSSLAWGREVRVGADIADSDAGPIYEDGSVALTAVAGSVREAGTPVDHDLEFVVEAPASGAAMSMGATWTLVDETGTVRCSQSAVLSIALSRGDLLRYVAKPQRNGVAWVASGAGDCHQAALEPISLTVQQGGVTRRLNAADQCNPSGAKPVATADWQLALASGRFELRALTAHSSLKTRLRYALRVGPRRIASGSLALTRVYRPVRLIVVADPAFQDFCVHGIYPMKWYGATIGCKIPGAMSVRLKLA